MIPDPSPTALHEQRTQKKEYDESVRLCSLYCLHTIVLYSEIIIAILGFLSAQQCFILSHYHLPKHNIYNNKFRCQQTQTTYELE